MVELVLYRQEDYQSAYLVACIIRFCEYDLMQAEQCAIIVKFKGYCSIKKGEFGELVELQEQFDSVGLLTKIK